MAALKDVVANIMATYRYICACAIVAAATATMSDNGTNSLLIPPDDIIQEYIDNLAEQYGWQSIICNKRRAREEDENPRGKKRMVKYDRERAYNCVMQDWMGRIPTFNDKQFERTFRLQRSMVEFILGHLAKHDSFWTSSIDAFGRRSIDPVVKFVTAQKLVCYGVSFSAFKDYVQMGETTARQCLHKLCRGIVECDDISAYYLRSPSKRDARRIVKLHKDKHGVDGMLGSLDVTHAEWPNCPAAWKGQFGGKDGKPTIALEAVIDILRHW